MGCTAPTSLLECMIVTKHVSLHSACATSCTDTIPDVSAATDVTVISPWATSADRQRSMAGCSMLEVITCDRAVHRTPPEHPISAQKKTRERSHYS
eukprot:COSAG01_NODE_8745_length_2674_cov_2.404660_4_plen_96_part_00